ncbi:MULTISPECIES: Uma2 family endonuclease [Pseudanabaena]|jgi:Uma2 family endonuclease|uniref:Uma2 family endonuclease n=1 Tax=Pseudanabaena TaxID=1152 RepID=UPI00247AB369|nr:MULTISPECIES: Uma2 family endonuclease [Pseudanabaena]MEA5488242.1 Uma2 family endonuclease [Pseudanabaena sp. CCNP1317]WGS74770.1 Uma2 family endonuclease [Pseudanabaena galeata CCNP1313]WGS75086.1 Uma2 family endonuclease [Pseudanabaena galeata CCNP1313]
MTTVIQSPVIETAKSPRLTLAEFLASPESDQNYEFIDGQVIRKMSPKRFHASLQAELLIFLRTLFEGKGFVYPEWGIVLTRNDQDWCPVPDLTYISMERLPSNVGNEMCPVPPELVIEIMSEGQTFREFVAKAGDYLKSGVLRVWVIDPMGKTLTVFYPDRPPETYQGDRLLTDELFPDLKVTVKQFLTKAGI